MVTPAGIQRMQRASLRVVEALVVAAVVFWVYAPALQGAFELDDHLFLASPQVTVPGDPWYLLKPGQPRPLTYLSFYWNFRFAGNEPWSYHLVNLLLHSANSILVYVVALLLLGRRSGSEAVHRWAPLASAAVFGLHPVQSEPVCYIYQRSTLLAALFSLAAMVLYLRGMSETERPRVWQAAAVCAAGLAIASKESAFALVLIWGAWKLNGTGVPGSRFAGAVSRREVWLPLLAAVLLAITAASALQPAAVGESARYATAQMRVVATYLRMLVWPAGLSIDHDVRLSPVPLPETIFAGVVILSLVVLAVYSRRWDRTSSFLGVAFFLLLAPTSSLIPRDDLMFEHRLYLPMIPFAVLVPWAAGVALGRLATAHLRIAAAAWALVLAVSLAAAAGATRTRARIWGDSIRLWSDAAEKSPRKARVRYNLAIAWLPVDRSRARQELERTVELSPDHAAALYNLGWLEQNSGGLDRARDFYERSLRADPLMWKADQNLGNLSVREGRLGEAERHFMKVVEQLPTYFPAYQSAATIQIQLGRFSEARHTLELWRTLQPDSLEARWLNASLLAAEGRTPDALEELRRLEGLDEMNAYRQRIQELRSALVAPPHALPKTR